MGKHEPVRTLDELLSWVEPIKKGIRAEFVGASVSTLGGPELPSLMLLVCLDPKETWANGILENSKYARFTLHAGEKLEQFVNTTGKPHFRKAGVKGCADLINRVNAWLEGVK